MCSLEKPHQAALRALLSEHRFEELEATLRGYQEAVDRDHACEGRMWSAFSAPYAHPDLESRRYHLDLFVATFPESFPLHAAGSLGLRARHEAPRGKSSSVRPLVGVPRVELRRLAQQRDGAIEVAPLRIEQLPRRMGCRSPQEAAEIGARRAAAQWAFAESEAAGGR